MRLLLIPMLAPLVAGYTNRIAAYTGPFEDPSCHGEALAYDAIEDRGSSECIALSETATCFVYYVWDSVTFTYSAQAAAASATPTTSTGAGPLRWEPFTTVATCDFTSYTDDACTEKVAYKHGMKGANIMSIPQGVRSFSWNCFYGSSAKEDFPEYGY